MDAKDVLAAGTRFVGSKVEVSGWLVDLATGLFILGDHYPPDYGFPQKIMISNSNLMRAILAQVTTLGGGRSKLFYRCKAIGKYEGIPPALHVDRLFVEEVRGSGNMEELNITDELIAEQVLKKGEYIFCEPRSPSQDWLDDL